MTSATSANAAEFVARFEDAWKAPLTKFVELFAEDGTLFQAGMERPLARKDIPAHQERTTTLLQIMALTVHRWAARDDYVFIEWTTAGSFLGKPVEWSGASRFTLRDGLITEEIAYFDTTPLRALINPALQTGDMAQAAIAATRTT